jgi:flagella basal body P-ring formation protein FlgA
VVSSRNGAALVAVIRAGDRLIVEENTAVVEARLEAVALGAAAPGSTFNVRLRIGGRVLRAVALGPGRAALAPVNGIEP